MVRVGGGVGGRHGAYEGVLRDDGEGPAREAPVRCPARHVAELLDELPVVEGREAADAEPIDPVVLHPAAGGLELQFTRPELTVQLLLVLEPAVRAEVPVRREHRERVALSAGKVDREEHADTPAMSAE